MSLIAIVTVQKMNIAHWYRRINTKTPSPTRHTQTKIHPTAIQKAAMHFSNIPGKEQIFRLCEWSFRFRNNPQSLEIQCAEVYYQMKIPGLKKVLMYIL